MTANVSFNPYGTNQPQASFLLQTQGYVQGVALDDPTSRNWLMQGILASSETVVMWGGRPVAEEISNNGTGSEGLGPTLVTPTAQANCTGFSVFNQMMHMVIAPGAPVPVAGTYNSVGFYRLGTNQRLAVACDPALISSISGSGDLINSQSLYWDVTNYRITLTTSGGNWALPASIKLLSTNTNSKIITYSNSTPSWTLGDAALILI